VHLQTRPGAGTAITLFIPANVPGVF
jgi:hypothetical protein